MTRVTAELRAYVIGAGATATPESVEEEKKRISALIDGADLVIVPVWGDEGPTIGFQFDTGPFHWGLLEIVRIESPRIVICRAVVEN